MPNHFGPLAAKIAETLRLAKIKLEQLRLSPDEPQLFAHDIIEIRLLPPVSMDAQGEASAFRSLANRDPVEAAAVLQNIHPDPVTWTIIIAAVKATAMLDEAVNPDAVESSLSIELLELALQAAQLCHIADWKRLAPILIELTSTETWLDELTPALNVGIFDIYRKYPQLGPHLEKLVQSIESQSRASEESARQRRPQQQLRIQAFVDAMRADPGGRPKTWSAAVSKLAFGGSEAKHVARAGRWLRLHRKEIEAALMAESPPDFPPARVEQ